MEISLLRRKQSTLLAEAELCNKTELKYQFKNVLLLGVVVRAFHPRTKEAEAEGDLCELRTAKATQ